MLAPQDAQCAHTAARASSCKAFGLQAHPKDRLAVVVLFNGFLSTAFLLKWGAETTNAPTQRKNAVISVKQNDIREEWTPPKLAQTRGAISRYTLIDVLDSESMSFEGSTRWKFECVSFSSSPITRKRGVSDAVLDICARSVAWGRGHSSIPWYLQ